MLGSGTGEPGQSFFAARPPILGGEGLEVRELDGVRAAVELPILARQVDPADLNLVTDALGRLREVWVRWQSMPNLDLSGPKDRHYVIERTGDRVWFGGRPAPPGNANIVLRSYRRGGGTAGTVTQLLGGCRSSTA